MKIKKLKCNGEISKLKANGYTHTTSKMTYNSKPDSDFDKKKLECEQGTQYFYKSKVVTTTTTKKPLTPEQKEERAKKCGYKTWDEYKADSFKCKTPAPGSRYQDCTGKTRKKGCIDSDGIIAKVQGCIGVDPDGKFWTNTEEQLKLKTGLVSFTTDQVDVICKNQVPGGGTSPAIILPQTQEEKEKYWDDLIEKERVYDQGFIYTLKDNTVVYIVKTELNNSDIKLPLPSLKGADLDLNDYIVMYPINKGDMRGKFGLLKKSKLPSGKETVIIEKNPRWYWSPEEEVESIDMFESKISNILKNVLSEQRFSGRLTSPTPTPGGTTAQTSQETKVNNVKLNSEVVKAVIEPIKTKTISLLVSIQDMSAFKVGANKDDKTNLTDAINKLNAFDSSKACDNENLRLIDNNLDIINTIISQNENKLGVGSIISTLKEVKFNLEKVKLECQRLSVESQTTTQRQQDQTTTQRQQDQRQQDQTTTQTTTQRQQDQPTTQETPKELDAIQCRDLVLQYLYGAFTASNMEGVGTAMATSRILDPKKIKNRLCGCYKLGDLNDIEITKNDFTSGKYRLNPDFLNFRFLNKKLKWPEIIKLVQTGNNKGFEIGRGYIDSTFGQREMCVGQINESIIQTIKSHISEAINKKKKLTENIVNRVTNKLIK